MANNDLQALYKMRDALKNEQYVKSYNENVKENLVRAVNETISDQIALRDYSYDDYIAKKNTRMAEKTNLFCLILPFAVQGVVLLILSLLAFAVSSDVPTTLLYIFIT